MSRVLVVGMAGILLALAACGGSDAAADIRRDVEASALALSQGRYEEYLRHFSASCRDRIDRTTFAAAVDGIARQFPGFQLTIKTVDVKSQEDDAAEIAVTSVIVGGDGKPVTTEAASPQTARVVKEGETWVTADCVNVPGYAPAPS